MGRAGGGVVPVALCGVRAVRESGLELNLGFIMFEPDTTLAELEENYNFLEELELLEDHELTANLLYHNQIVLRGSGAWERFAGEGRLLLDARLPFEARYLFRDERVEGVSLAMGRLTAAYFSAMNDLKRINPAAVTGCGAEVNTLLKEAFRSLILAASTLPAQGLAGVEDEYAARLREIYTPG